MPLPLGRNKGQKEAVAAMKKAGVKYLSTPGGCKTLSEFLKASQHAIKGEWYFNPSKVANDAGRLELYGKSFDGSPTLIASATAYKKRPTSCR